MRARLFAAFVAVALAGIAVLALLLAAGVRPGADRVVGHQRQQLAQQVAADLADAYLEAGGWVGADLGPALRRVADVGARMVVRDERGRVVASQGDRLGSAAGRWAVQEIEADGQRVGVVTLRFPAAREIGTSSLAVLWRWIALAALAALVVAVAVAAVVSRRITRPLQRLSDAVGRLRRGEREVQLDQFPGELGEVAEAVTGLAAELDAQERLRRAALADVTHELRTPVAILQGYLEEMIDGGSQPDAAALAMLHDEVLRMGRLIGDLEVLRDAEDAALRLEHREVDLAVIASRAVDALNGPASDAGVRFERELAPAVVEGDPGRLAQVALNLLDNAIKHGGAGSVTIRTMATGGSAVLEVVDHGPGLPEADLPHLFDRYWRGRAADSVAGSGIGLTVVREIVTAHGGTVTAGPTQGGGTTVRVVLPVREPPTP